MSDYIKRKDVLDKTVNRNGIWDKITNAEGKGLTEIVNEIPPADVIERREYDAVVAENRFLKAMQLHLTKDMDLTELGKMVAKNLEGTR